MHVCVTKWTLKLRTMVWVASSHSFETLLRVVVVQRVINLEGEDDLLWFLDMSHFPGTKNAHECVFCTYDMKRPFRLLDHLATSYQIRCSASRN